MFFTHRCPGKIVLVDPYEAPREAWHRIQAVMRAPEDGELQNVAFARSVQFTGDFYRDLHEAFPGEPLWEIVPALTEEHLTLLRPHVWKSLGRDDLGPALRKNRNEGVVAGQILRLLLANAQHQKNYTLSQLCRAYATDCLSDASENPPEYSDIEAEVAWVKAAWNRMRAVAHLWLTLCEFHDENKHWIFGMFPKALAGEVVNFIALADAVLNAAQDAGIVGNGPESIVPSESMVNILPAPLARAEALATCEFSAESLALFSAQNFYDKLRTARTERGFDMPFILPPSILTYLDNREEPAFPPLPTPAEELQCFHEWQVKQFEAMPDHVHREEFAWMLAAPVARMEREELDVHYFIDEQRGYARRPALEVFRRWGYLPEFNAWARAVTLLRQKQIPLEVFRQGELVDKEVLLRLAVEMRFEIAASLVPGNSLPQADGVNLHNTVTPIQDEPLNLTLHYSLCETRKVLRLEARSIEKEVTLDANSNQGKLMQLLLRKKQVHLPEIIKECDESQIALLTQPGEAKCLEDTWKSQVVALNNTFQNAGFPKLLRSKRHRKPGDPQNLKVWLLPDRVYDAARAKHRSNAQDITALQELIASRRDVIDHEKD